MKIEKQFTLDAAPTTVWDFITTPEKVGPCIPGCENVEVVEPGKYRAEIKVAAGPIKTTFHVTVTATEERPPRFASYTTQGDEGGKASRISAKSTLEISALAPDQSTVQYTSDITISGRLGKFAAGVMRKMADSIGEEFIVAIREGIQQDRT